MKLATMKISIVIPVYNEAAHLTACLKAIADQSLAAYEVIVVDNNSTDNSRLVAERFSFVRVMSEPKQGRVHARNRGFDAARGDVIARIDGDTLLPSDWLQQIATFYIHPNHLGQAFTGGASFYNVRLPRAVSWLYNFLAFDFNRLLIGHATLWGSNMAITQAQWQVVRDKTCDLSGMHEDLDLAMHLHGGGYGIHYERSLKVGAHLRRVRSNRHELWDYLQWWPRTLRLHAKRSWVICWFFGSLMLYLLAPLLNFGEYLARQFGRAPIPELRTGRLRY